MTVHNSLSFVLKGTFPPGVWGKSSKAVPKGIGGVPIGCGHAVEPEICSTNRQTYQVPKHHTPTSVSRYLPTTCSSGTGGQTHLSRALQRAPKLWIVQNGSRHHRGMHLWGHQVI